MSAEGYFGPESIFWQVNKEMYSLFGGARALLMQAAHPLVSAGARQTSFYARDPWKRLIRTVQLQLILAFGSRQEAESTADRVNKLHETINGIDPVTGLRYDALDLDLLLRSVRKTHYALIVHDAVRRCGIGAEWAALLAEHAFDFLDAPILRLGGKETPVPYAINLEKAFMPSEADIVDAVLRLTYRRK